MTNPPRVPGPLPLGEHEPQRHRWWAPRYSARQVISSPHRTPEQCPKPCPRNWAGLVRDPTTPVLTTTPSANMPPRARQLHSLELIALLAGLMSVHAMAIDIMLPALPAMGAALGVTNGNNRQLVIVAFVLGLGLGQLILGPLSDRFGRRPVILVSLGGYAGFAAACVFARNFEQLVAFRAAQGLLAAGARVITLSLARDLFEGASMARVMSWVMTVFMAVPIIAPNVGHLILKVSTWHMIFWVLVANGLLLSAWVALRLPETLPVERRRSIDPRALVTAYLEVFKNPISRSYALASGIIFGALFAFISSSEQLFRSFGRAETFPLYFAGVASAMAVASIVNARVVERFGPKRLSHGAVMAFTAIQIAYLCAYYLGFEGFLPYYASVVAGFFMFSLIGANFNAMALQPLGHVAGTASAALGFASTTISGGLGGLIAAQFDGTPLPVAVGFLGLGVSCLLVVTFGTRAAPRSS